MKIRELIRQLQAVKGFDDKEVVVRVGAEFVNILGTVADDEVEAVAIEIDFEYDRILDEDTHEWPFT